VKRLALALCLTLSLTTCGEPPEVKVEDAWTRATVGDQTNAAVFMTITSPSGDRLVGASAPVAGKTDLMTMQGGSDAMEMAYVEDILIPVRAPVHLEPSGLHVWLADLKQPLRNGESFPLTLEFEKAGEHEVRVAIIGPAAPAPMSGMEM
jgi:copper(I)-binding protein